jgi:2,4-dienoyl-CoA reductase-like NADH-dependent reductase (Old Yellow Enzyme family)
LFAQLFHPGREILSTPNGMMPIAYAPSAVPNERFRIMPKRMSVELIEEIVDGFAQTASRLSQAGFDGVELVGSHGYLIAQFLSPLANQRNDQYGGDFERRLCFVKDCVNAIRKKAPDMTMGLRLSSNDYEPDGLDESAVTMICLALEDSLDYFSLVVGSSATLGASVHVSAPMGLPTAYAAPQAAIIKKNLNKPVIVTGRINQPQEAEKIIASGQADLSGLTRALICDPEMPAKAHKGDIEDIRACIACNQSCIGRAHKGLGISCIRYP